MFFRTAISIALALSSTGSAFSFFGSKSSRDVSFKMSVVESLAVPPAGWLLDDSTKFDKDTSTVTLRIHLVQQDMDKFHELAMNVRTCCQVIKLFANKSRLRLPAMPSTDNTLSSM